MSILVLADVHANLEALEAVIADAKSRGEVEAIWGIGDYVGYGPDPNACLDLLRGYSIVAVAGNHDLAACGSLPLEEGFDLITATSLRWTQTELTEGNKSWLRSLQRTLTESDFTFAHGSLVDPVKDTIKTSFGAKAHLEKQTTPYGFVAQSHLSFAFFAEGASDYLPGRDGLEVKLDGRKLVANPGSAGQPRDGNPRAAYIEIDSERTKLTFHRVDYDFRATQTKMRDAHLPFDLVDRLEKGR